MPPNPLMLSPDEIATNFSTLQQAVAQACAQCGRNPDSVSIMAVSKGHPPETIEAAAAAGLTLFGESRVQEARAKIPVAPGRLRWHLIGHLQSNKAKDAVQWFEMVQSVDSLGLARELDKQANKAAKTVPILLEINVSGEGTKFGFTPESVLALAETLLPLKRLEVRGFMTIAPWTSQTERVRSVFRSLRLLRDTCEQAWAIPLPILSMGMSSDYSAAIAEGSTLIRIGTALLGERPPLRKPEPTD
jgi:pyridoxal phosphate enzyme (YggS family)